MCNILGWNCILDDEESILVELMVCGFSRGEVAWVMRIETLLNDSPNISINMIQMAFKAIDPRVKILILHNLRRRTRMI